MKVLIVDDENLARDRLARMLSDIDGYEVAGEAAHGAAAIEQVNNLQPDLLLLDIRMPGMDGLEVARHIATMEEPPAIVFCTAYEEHAIEAFNLEAVGYLLKPVRREQLGEALGKAQRVNRAQMAALRESDDAQRTHVAARTRRGLELIAINDVRYFHADQKYVTVRHVNGETIIDETLRDLEDEFAQSFVRIHRATLVSAQHIAGLEKAGDGGQQLLLMDIDERLDVSRRHLPAVRRFIRQRHAS